MDYFIDYVEVIFASSFLLFLYRSWQAFLVLRLSISLNPEFTSLCFEHSVSYIIYLIKGSPSHIYLFISCFFVTCWLSSLPFIKSLFSQKVLPFSDCWHRPFYLVEFRIRIRFMRICIQPKILKKKKAALV